MTDDEAFNKYSKELTADFGTSKLVHLDDHLQIAEITIFTDEALAKSTAVVLKTNYILIEHFSDYCFFYHGISFLKVFDLDTNRLTDFCRMRPRKAFDLEALKQELKKLRSGIFTD